MELNCDKCKFPSSRYVYRGEDRLCGDCAAYSPLPAWSGAHTVHEGVKRHGVRMTLAEANRIKSTKRLSDGSPWRPERWRGD